MKNKHTKKIKAADGAVSDPAPQANTSTAEAQASPDKVSHKKKQKFKFFGKKSDSAESIESLYKEAEKLFEDNQTVAKDVKEEEQILAQIMDKRKKRKKRIIIAMAFVLLVIIAAASVFGFFFFNKKRQFAEDKISLEIIGPEKAMIGDEVTYLINYQNQGAINLKDIAIIVRAPRGLRISEKSPQTESNTWKLENLRTNESGQIKIKGKLIDHISNEQQMTVTFIYVPENFNSEFSKVKSQSTRLDPVELTTEIDSPAAAVPGQKINISLKYKNETAQDIAKIALKLVSPGSYEFIQSSPASDNQTWELIDLKADSAEQQINVEGKFSEDINLDETEKEQKFSLEVLYIDELGEKFVQSEKQFSIDLSDQELLTYVLVNGKSENSNINFGQNIIGTAVFKNSSANDLTDITAKLKIDQLPVAVINWQDSKIASGTLSSTDSGKEIYWNIDNLKAGSEIVYDFTLPVKKLTALQDFSAESLAEQRIKIFSEFNISDNESPIRSSDIEIALNTNLTLGIKALYYDANGNQIGSGPLPPRIGEKTTFKLYWDVSNSLHEITDIKVKTTLANRVSWENKNIVSTGGIKYDAEARQVIWEISRLPQNVKEAHTNFEIGLTPVNENLGKLMPLTETTTIEAKDAKTGQTLFITLNPLTSNLEFDEQGSDQGVVVE
ncbi:MAG: hypothetical protein ACOZBH_01070 [Patescibacteria group bacterium]